MAGGELGTITANLPAPLDRLRWAPGQALELTSTTPPITIRAAPIATA